MLRIDPNWSLVDLDPLTWRNIGRFLNPGQYIRAGRPDEHALFVLHTDGQILRVVDSKLGPRPDLGSVNHRTIGDPYELAHSLYVNGEWERVHVIDKKHLAHVASAAQNSQGLWLDAYYRRVFDLLWHSDPAGYVVIPTKPDHWQGWTYQQLDEFCELLPLQASVALGVFDPNTKRLAIGLIIKIENQAITAVTTFEALDFAEQPVELSNHFLEQLCTQLEQKIAPPGAVLLCDQPTFEAWLVSPDKVAFLGEAAQSKQLFWKFRN
jgi:hypothetical protein